MTAKKKAAKKPVRKKAAKNPLRGKKASVAIHRNGLTIEVADVPASESAQVGGILLSAMRTMVKGGFDELIPDAGAIHAGPFGEVPDDDAEIETRAQERERKRIGFV